MSAAATSLLESVLALPKRDRLKIAEALLDSMPKETVELDDAALVEELKRRADEARSDPSAGIPWSEVKKMR